MATMPYLALEGVKKLNMTIILAKKNGYFDINHFYWYTEILFFCKVEQFETLSILTYRPMTTKPYLALQGVQKINMTIISAKKWGF